MSTTDKLEHALRDLTKHCVRLLGSGRDSILQAGGDCDALEVMERGDPYLAKAREALAEYDATPAVEVTADAVEIACDAAMRSHNPAEVWPVHYSTTEQENARKAMQAALAAAFPALVQQVENLKTDYALVAGHYRGLLEKYDTLLADNTRLTKDAERWRTLVTLVHAEEWNGWDVLVPPNLKREAEGDLVAAVDAATAQAKQAEGGSCS